MNISSSKQFLLYILICGVISSVFIFFSILKSISITNSTPMRDSTQIFLMSNSLIEQTSPYESISELRNKYLSIKDPYQNHPSPYPLLLPIIAIPLTSLDITSFTYTWFVLYLLLLFLSVEKILCVFSKSPPSKICSLGITSLLVPSLPVSGGLSFGQVDPLLLFLLVLALVSLSKQKNFQASLYFTLITCVKTIGAPFIFSALIVRKFRFGALLAIGMTTFLTLYFIGYSGIENYLTHVTKEVVRYYLFFPQNLSIASFSNKLLLGFNLIHDGTRILPLDMQPLINENFLNLSILIPPLLCTVLCLILRKKEHLSIILFPLCIFCSPILWSFYFLLFIPLFLREILFGSTKSWRIAALFVFIFSFYIDTNTLSFSLSSHAPLTPFMPTIGVIIASMSPVMILFTYSLSVLVRDIRTPFILSNRPLFFES